MSSDFADSSRISSARLGYEPRLSSQRFDSARFESFEGLEEEFPPFGSGGAGNGPILPPPAPAEAEEGFALREWRRKNAIRLEEKERREKEMVKAIIEEAEEYKAEYYRKWKIRCENSRAANREKEKLYLEGREKFHGEADKSHWKAVAELVLKEIPTIEKKGKKKPSIVVVQGPKPGKPTDLSRMRQVLVKLKHQPPVHMMPLLSEPGKDAEPRVTTHSAASASTSTPNSVGLAVN